MRTIAVMNQKGGCGKTTVCLHLAIGLSRDSDAKVAIFDADQQRSATRWAAKAPQFNRKAPKVVSVQAEDLEGHLKASATEHDFSLVDTAGDFKAAAQHQALELLPLVDLVIVPILPTPLDVDGAHDLLQALKAYRTANAKAPQVLLVLNKSKRNGLTRQAKDMLPSFGFPITKTALQDRVAYASEVGFGGTAYDRRPSDKARQEIESFVAEVKGYL